MHFYAVPKIMIQRLKVEWGLLGAERKGNRKLEFLFLIESSGPGFCRIDMKTVLTLKLCARNPGGKIGRTTHRGSYE